MNSAMIAVKNDEGAYLGIRCYENGDVENLGYNLTKHFGKYEDVIDLCMAGDVYHVDKVAHEYHEENNYQTMLMMGDIDALREAYWMCEYFYLFEGGEWKAIQNGEWVAMNRWAMMWNNIWNAIKEPIVLANDKIEECKEYVSTYIGSRVLTFKMYHPLYKKYRRWKNK